MPLSTAESRPNLSTDEFLAQELERAKEALQPISRRALAVLLAAREGKTFREAMDAVDLYCDEHAPYVPGYVSSEFGIFWLKVVAVVVAVGGVGLFWRGAVLMRLNKPAWVWFAGATVVLGFAVLSWVKSLEAERRPV